MRAGKLVTITEAARTLEVGGLHPSLWLIRRLRRLKADTGIDLLVPSSTNAKRPRFRVSMHRLRRHLPELFDVEGEKQADIAEVAGAFTQVLRKIDRKLETIDDRIDGAEQKVGAIAHSLARNRQISAS